MAAASRSAGLQQALDQINQLSQDRSDVLRTSSHDLKSTFGAIRGAAYLLEQEGNTSEERAQFTEMLNRNLTSIQGMLMELTDLARLEAGQESVTVQAFDASALLRETAASAQPVATEKGLVLWMDGPESLPVRGDSVKVQRIVQNLLLNALQYTPKGIVSLSWSRESTYRWYVSVQDSGPGLPPGLVKLLAQQLEPTVDASASLTRDESTDSTDPPPADSQQEPTSVRGGEGIGLHIVKRLCELLGASLGIERQPGVSTLFRVRFLIEQES